MLEPLHSEGLSSGRCRGYLSAMATVSIRRLEQHASDILRAVELGEITTVTVAGRAVAEIVPVRRSPWTSWDRVAQVFDSPTDPSWDLDAITQGR